MAQQKWIILTTRGNDVEPAWFTSNKPGEKENGRPRGEPRAELRDEPRDCEMNYEMNPEPAK